MRNEDNNIRIFKFNAYNKSLERSIEVVIDLYKKNTSLQIDAWDVLDFISDYLSKMTLEGNISKQCIEEEFSKELVQKVWEVLPDDLLLTLNSSGGRLCFIKSVTAKEFKKYSRKKIRVAILTCFPYWEYEFVSYINE